MRRIKLAAVRWCGCKRKRAFVGRRSFRHRQVKMTNITIACIWMLMLLIHSSILVDSVNGSEGNKTVDSGAGSGALPSALGLLLPFLLQALLHAR